MECLLITFENLIALKVGTLYNNKRERNLMPDIFPSNAPPCTSHLKYLFLFCIEESLANCWLWGHLHSTRKAFNDRKQLLNTVTKGGLPLTSKWPLAPKHCFKDEIKQENSFDCGSVDHIIRERQQQQWKKTSPNTMTLNRHFPK